MTCKQCKIETKNPSFCSKSCAARFNNVHRPRRKKTKQCKNCGILIRSNRTYCNTTCNYAFNNKKTQEEWDQITLGDLKGEGNANVKGRYPYIRELSRKKYIASGLPQQCKICNYNLHFEVCHVKAVQDFGLTDTIKEINDLSNLVALCRNHHWEFDHGFLTLWSN